jgi:hypothetical protein
MFGDDLRGVVARGTADNDNLEIFVTDLAKARQGPIQRVRTVERDNDD